MAKEKTSGAPGERQKFYFQFITTPTADTPGTSLLLHFDSKRYLFGRLSEGTQRACIQRGVGIKKVRNMFLTGATTWSSIGGLIGMILTMADVQSEELDPDTGKRLKMKIHGAPKLIHSIACARRFVFRTGMPLEVYEADARVKFLSGPNYIDENISVWSIAARRRGRSGINSPHLPNGRSQSPDTVDREQNLRADTVKNMFDSDWRKDRLVESRFDEVKLPALIWTRNAETKELSYTQCATMADAPHLRPDSKVLVRNPWPASLLGELPPVDNIAGSVAVSYVVKGKPQRGKFQPQKAKELGVKPGPDNAILANGGSITLENGTIITSEMVLAKTEPGKGMAILDVPSEDYLEDLTEKIEALRGEFMEGLETISWLLGREVVFSTAFTELLKSLPGVQHIVSSPDLTSNYIALDSAAASSIRLSQILPECFKVPVHDNNNLDISNSQTHTSFIPAERGLMVQVAPRAILNRSEIPQLLDVEATKDSYKEVLSDLMPISEPSNGQPGPYDDVQLFTLGTGSAVPSKYRNVSATLLRIPGSGSHLFDCGENTLGMLQRTFTAEQLDDVLVDLRMIWISHLHADHHLGTLSVIEAKREAMQRLGKTEPRLHVVSEPNMADYLNDYASIQSSAYCSLLSVVNSEISAKNGELSGSKISISQTLLPVKEFQTTKVSHCHGAQACSITFDNGFKFSYSGDCRPSAQFAKIGLHSDVLLHEATFDDGLEGDAMAKKHSTTTEALGVAYAMKAKNVVLTHFSQRYQKIPVLDKVKFGEVRFEESNDAEEAGPIEDNTSILITDHMPDGAADKGTDAIPEAHDPDSVATLQQVASEMNVCVAFDLMSVKVGQIRDMYKYYPAIEKMFELEHEKSEAKREERRTALEQMKEEKEKRENKQKGTTSPAKKNQQTKSKGGDLYERINRNKQKGSKDTNDSTAPSSANAATEINTTGGNDASDNIPPSPMSNKARKRQLKQAQIAQHKQDAQDVSAQPSSGLEGVNGAEHEARHSSAEPEASEAKRPKLDNATTQTPA